MGKTLTKQLHPGAMSDHCIAYMLLVSLLDDVGRGYP